MKKVLLFVFLYLQTFCFSAENSQNNKLKVLLGSSVYRNPNILKEFLGSLKKLEKDSFTLDYIFIDDDEIEDSSKLLKDFKNEVESHCLILRSSNDLKLKCEIKDHMIQRAIIGNYDYLLLIDSDLWLHPKTIEQLIKAKKDIISNVFWTNDQQKGKGFPQVSIIGEYPLCNYEINQSGVQEESNKKTSDSFNILKKPGIYETEGLGACTLISKNALKKGLSFNKINKLTLPTEKGLFCREEDRYFCIRAAALDLSLFIDTHYPAYHIYRETDLSKKEKFIKDNEVSNITNQLVSNSNYPAFQEINVDKSHLWYFMESCGPGAYLKPCVLEHIDKKNISSILEIGSRDLRDAIDLSGHYKCHVFAFECNPECLKICRKNEQCSPNVTLINKAVWDKTGTILFYPTIHEEGKISDPGSSSCFKMTEKTLNNYSQTSIEVEAIRLDDWMRGKKFKNIDLICMDTQGATLKILQSMGDFLKKTKYIITECEIENLYEGECLLPELVSFLNKNEFELIPTKMRWDYLFENKKLKNSKNINTITSQNEDKESSLAQIDSKNLELTSRFILKTDPKMNNVSDIQLRASWWSRPFEYKWASQFSGPDYVVLDAACGISHPFKWLLSDTCAKVWACDVDPKILDCGKIIQDTQNDLGEEAYKIIKQNIHRLLKVKLVCSSICNLPDFMPMFDRIFCISTLEHFSIDDRKKTLEEFARKLTPNGLLVITVDYPIVKPEDLIEMAESVGLIPAGDVELGSPPENSLNNVAYFPALHIYRCVLKHK